MKLQQLVWGIIAISMALAIGGTFTGCGRTSSQVWEDSKSCGRHMTRGLRTMGGKHGDSRAIQCRDEFMPMEDQAYASYGAGMEEFVPLSNQPYEDEVAMADYVSQQPRETPGDPGSTIPSIEAFHAPTVNSTWAAIFRNVLFDYNSNLVKGQDNLDTVRAIATYMKKYPNTYVFVEGHCDERGPEAYNLALGARRSNAVRNLLIQEGSSPDRIFTISYGKERLLFHDQSEESHAQNRRAEFKIYQR